MPWPLYPEEKSPGTHSIGSLVSKRAALNALEKREVLAPATNLNTFP